MEGTILVRCGCFFRASSKACSGMIIFIWGHD